MASLTKHSNGCWMIQFTFNRKRKTIYPGKMPKKNAQTFRIHVEALVAARKSGTSMPGATAEWIQSNDDVRPKLHKVGLIEADPEAKESPSLRLFVEKFLEADASIKESTLTVWRRCQKQLENFFNCNRPIDSITLSDAKDFREYLLKEGNRKTKGGLSENSTRKMCSIARQIFQDAVDREIIDKNPFSHKSIPTNVRPNRSRDYFIDEKMANAVLDSCPDPEWRLIFALSRWGGFRCPSETLALEWSNIRWESGIIVVNSPKTVNQGKEFREFPLIPILETLLAEAQEQTSSNYVIGNYRSSEANLRTQLHRIIRKAGYQPWPKAFNNLRASCETELLEHHPYHVVCAWMGHTKAVSMSNYAQVRQEDFDKARLRTAKSNVTNAGKAAPTRTK